jgi:hypothetical protein
LLEQVELKSLRLTKCFSLFLLYIFILLKALQMVVKNVFMYLFSSISSSSNLKVGPEINS